MANDGIWNQTQVQNEAAKIEAAARCGDSTRAFQQEDRDINNSSINPEVRKANASAVSRQLEKDGFLPVCAFDMAKASQAPYQKPECGDGLLGSGRLNKDLVVYSPSISIERELFSKEQRTNVDMHFGTSTRPDVPRDPKSEAPANREIKEVAPAKVEKSATEKLLETMNARLEVLEKKNTALETELAEYKSGKRTSKVDAPKVEAPKVEAKAEVPKVFVPTKPEAHKVEAPAPKPVGPAKAEVHKPEAKAEAFKIEAPKVTDSVDNSVMHSLLKQTVGKIDLITVVAVMNTGDGYTTPEVKPRVSITEDKDGAMHIKGEPYGTIDLDAKTQYKLDKDGAIVAKDSAGKSYRFYSSPTDTGMVLQTDDGHGNFLNKFAPNKEKLISQVVTRNSKEWTSRSEYNSTEGDYSTNPLAVRRDDWMTGNTEIYDAQTGKLKTQVLDFGKSADEGIRKVQEIHHYNDDAATKRGVAVEHIYDNGYKFTELATGQTYIQRRVVAREDNPDKFRIQSEKNASVNDPETANGSLTYGGKTWALSNKQLRPGIHIEGGQRDTPEGYRTWYTEGELDP